jgi:hypothetical protein
MPSLPRAMAEEFTLSPTVAVGSAVIVSTLSPIVGILRPDFDKSEAKKGWFPLQSAC